MNSLERERRRLDAMRWKEYGAYCRACGQHTEVYARWIYREQSRSLARLVKLWKKEERWYHVRDFNKTGGTGGGDFAKLRFWHLIRGQGKYSGLWQPTERGILFVQNKLAVPRYLFTYDNDILSESRETVTFEDTLSAKFNPDLIRTAKLQ